MAEALDGPAGRETVSFVPVLRSANETLLQLGALEGMGLAVLPTWLISSDLAEKRLETVLPEVRLGAQLYGVYPSRKYLSAKVRTFLDFIASDRRLKYTSDRRA